MACHVSFRMASNEVGRGLNLSEPNDFRKSLLHVATDPMNLEAVTKVSKKDLVSHEESAVSPMPEGLLDTLTIDEILALLAYVESGGRSGD